MSLRRLALWRPAKAVVMSGGYRWRDRAADQGLRCRHARSRGTGQWSAWASGQRGPVVSVGASGQRGRVVRRGPVVPNRHPAQHPRMRVVVTSNDLVRLSFLTALLADAGIEATLLDNHTSILEGSAGAIPRRLVVRPDDFVQACRVLRDAGEC